MTGSVSGRTREDALLLGVAVVAVCVAVAVVRQASPPHLGLWMAAAVALGLALATLFALWLGGAARRVVGETLFGEWNAARTVLSAIPDGLYLVDDGIVRSVNRQLCDVLGFDREESRTVAASDHASALRFLVGHENLGARDGSSIGVEHESPDRGRPLRRRDEVAGRRR